ncbi:hypothetical protein F441_11508 [Phytophthora nicotianae CJ01A1]|uniref:Uncharacterized protein n=1 Tax=Phytophthora nicotianae CJ01A1 TaxID=1317063 RepID=W2WSF6_PHYNI|nr:hypothetical protein F441_11508 [Phytophthora nicotianae CJ01A1]
MDASDEGLAVLDPAHKRYLQIRFDDEERHDITSAPDANGFTATSENSSALPWRLLYSTSTGRSLSVQDVLANLQAHALAESSHHKYAATSKQWCRWCTSAGTSPWLTGDRKADSTQLIAFAISCWHRAGGSQGNSASTILSKLGHINWYHRVSSAILSVSMQDTDSLCKGCHRCRQHHEGNAQCQPFFSVDSAPTAISSPKTTAFFGGGCGCGIFLPTAKVGVLPDHGTSKSYAIQRRDVTFWTREGVTALSANVYTSYKSSSEEVKQGWGRPGHWSSPHHHGCV